MVACKGITIPQYKSVIHKGWRYNEDKKENLYYVEEVKTESEPICADCKQITCKDEYDPRKEEVYLRPT